MKLILRFNKIIIIPEALNQPENIQNLSIMQLQDKEGVILLRLKHLLSLPDEDDPGEIAELMTKLQEVQSLLESKGINAMPLPKELRAPAPALSYDSHEQYEHLMASANERLKRELAQQRLQISQLLGELESVRQDRRQQVLHNGRLLSELTLLKAQLQGPNHATGKAITKTPEKKAAEPRQTSNIERQLNQKILHLQQQVQAQAAQLRSYQTDRLGEIKRLEGEIKDKKAELNDIQNATTRALDLYAQVKTKLGPFIDILHRLGLRLDPPAQAEVLEDLDPNEPLPEPEANPNSG